MANEIWKLVNELHRRASAYERYMELPDNEKIAALKSELERVNIHLARTEIQKKSFVTDCAEAQSGVKL